MVMKRQTTQYDYIEDVKANVLQKFPLLGVTMSKLDTQPTEGILSQIIDTAATNGKTVYFNPEYFQGLNEDQRAFIYAHEVMHVAFNHIMRSKGKQPKLWNTATDAVINQILKKEGYEIVGEGIDMPEALNHSAEEMYEKLLTQQKQNNQDNNQQSSGNQDNQDNQESSQNNQNQTGNSQNQEQNSENQENKENQQEDKNSAGSQDKQNEQDEQKTQNGQSENEKDEDKGDKSDEKQSEDAKQGESGKQSDEQNSKQGQDGESSDAQNSQPDNADNARSSTPQNNQTNSPTPDIEAELTDEQSSIQHGHGLWQQAVEDSEKEEAQAKKSLFERIKGIFKPNEQPEKDENADPEENNSEEDFLAQNRKLRHKKQQEVKQKISEHKKEVLDAVSQIESDMPSHRDIGESQQVADWKKILKQNMLDPEDKWSYRRSGADNDYMARSEELEDEVKAKTEVMIDVSGSVDEELVREFLRQLKPLLKRSDIMVGCFDDEFYPFKEIKTRKDIDNFRVPGGGGTDLDLAVRSFSADRNVNKIVFTDGEGEMPHSDLKNVKNLFWVVYQNSAPSWYYEDRYINRDWFKPVCGKVIYVERKEIAQNFIQRQNKYIGR